MIKDTLGNEWIVLKGDPGFPAVRHLQLLGFQQVVLPVPILAGKATTSEYLTVNVESADALNNQRHNDCILGLESFKGNKDEQSNGEVAQVGSGHLADRVVEGDSTDGSTDPDDNYWTIDLGLGGYARH